MTQKQAVQIMYEVVEDHIASLHSQIDSGPEGTEIYLQPEIDKLTQALDILQNGG